MSFLNIGIRDKNDFCHKIMLLFYQEAIWKNGVQFKERASDKTKKDSYQENDIV